MSFRPLLTMLITSVGLLLQSSPALACAFESSESHEEQQVSFSSQVSKVLLLSKDHSHANHSESSGDCCSICKVYTVKGCNDYHSLKVPFIIINNHSFQAKACRNANSGSWHPPKA